MTQLQLSELIPCEPSTLAHYETGKNLVSMTRLKKISEVLEIEPYQLFISANNKLDTNKPESIMSLLKTANDVQLGLIYNFISTILELVPKK